MDILTRRGAVSRGHELDAMRIFQQHLPEVDILETPKDSPARLDGLLAANGVLVGGYEVKCRYKLRLNTLMTTFGGEWLLTAAKLRECVDICKGLQIPFFGLLYLVDEDALLVQRLWNVKSGTYKSIRFETTTTQKTINGGSIARQNAFIDMTNCKVYRR